MAGINISPLGPTFEAQQSQLAQQRELVRALLAQQAEGGGKGYLQAGDRIVPDWGAAIGNLLGGYQYNKEKSALNRQEEEFSRNYSAGLNDVLAKYVAAREGTSGMNPEVVNGEQVGPPTPDVKGDPMRAVQLLIGSGMPELKQMGMAEMAAMLKREQPKWSSRTVEMMGPNGYGTYMLDESGQNPPRMIGGGKASMHSINNYLVPTIGPQVMGKADFADQFGPVGAVGQGTNGPIMGQLNARTGKASFAPPGTNVNLGVSVGKKQQEIDLETIGQSRKDVQGMIPMMQSLVQARNIAANIDPAMLGPGAPVVQFGGQLMAQLGGKLPEGVRNLEDLDSALGQQVLANARTLAPVTKEDISQLQQILGAKTNSKEGLVTKLDMAVKLLGSKIDRHNDFVQAVGKSHMGAGWVKSPEQYSHYLADWKSVEPGPSEIPKGKVRVFNPATGKLE